MDGEELLGIVPYISYKFSFPVMVPKWGGVMVVHPDGETEKLTPEEATEDPRFEGERLYPEQLARKVGDVWKYRNGYWNTWFAHEDEAVIPRIDASEEPATEASATLDQATSTGQMPFLIPTQEGPQWFLAAEPYGRSFSMYRAIYVDAHSGDISFFDPGTGSALIGVNKALNYAKATFPNYQWGQNAVILEPRPGNKRRKPLLDGDHHKRRQSGRQPDGHGQRLRAGRGNGPRNLRRRNGLCGGRGYR